jgi:ubiquitin-protein ligase
LNISKILLTIEAVLHEPDTQYPLDAELLEAYHEDPAQFQSKAPIKLEGSV